MPQCDRDPLLGQPCDFAINTANRLLRAQNYDSQHVPPEASDDSAMVPLQAGEAVTLSDLCDGRCGRLIAPVVSSRAGVMILYANSTLA